MKKLVLISALLALPFPVMAREAPQPAVLKVTVGDIQDGQPIANKFAYCIPDGQGTTKAGGNTSPAIRWSGAPKGTRSYAIIMVDPDVPASFELANKPGKTIPEDFKRQNFYHWVLVNIPSRIRSLSEGQASRGIVPGGKPLGKTSYGTNGQNDYVKMGKGPNGGYDGPCPPWNDERLHNYHFIVYALDIPRMNLRGPFNGGTAEDTIASHIIGRGETVGTFTNKP